MANVEAPDLELDETLIDPQFQKELLKPVKKRPMKVREYLNSVNDEEVYCVKEGDEDHGAVTDRFIHNFYKLFDEEKLAFNGKTQRPKGMWAPKDRNANGWSGFFLEFHKGGAISLPRVLENATICYIPWWRRVLTKLPRPSSQWMSRLKRANAFFWDKVAIPVFVFILGTIILNYFGISAK